MDLSDIRKRFGVHKIISSSAEESRCKKIEAIANSCLALARILNKLCPEGRELALAITKLEEVSFWAQASISRSR